MRRISTIAPITDGGILLYCQYQADAFTELNLNTTLISPDMLSGPVSKIDEVHAVLPRWQRAGDGDNKLLTKLSNARRLLKSFEVSSKILSQYPPHDVLTQYSEYLSPFWYGHFNKLKRRGFNFHTVLHDPARSYAVGPRKWHRYSVKRAFDLYDTVFIHGSDHGDIPPHKTVVKVPHGPFDLAKPTRSSAEIRARHNIPLDAPLLVQFGFIRDYKNIDLSIKAMREVDAAHLLIVGAEHSGSRGAKFYRDLAKNCGVDSRCHFVIGYQSDAAAANYISAGDALCLTYSKEFISSSGVLASAVNYRVPCLCSSGSLDTRREVKDYAIGEWVEPDDLESLVQGMKSLLASKISPDWERYERDFSWRRNARIIYSTLNQRLRRDRG